MQLSLLLVRRFSSSALAAGDLRFHRHSVAGVDRWWQEPLLRYPWQSLAWNFKVADDARGPAIDPTTMERQISNEGLAAARRFLGRRFPGMAAAPLLESRVCQYENSTDQNFIFGIVIPRRRMFWIVGGGSGHGFKHGSSHGRDGWQSRSWPEGAAS